MSSATDSPRLEEKGGMIAVAVAATISAVACSSLSLYIAFLFYQVKRSENKRWAPEVQLRTKFLRTQFGLLFMNLLLADLIQSIGFALNFHWVAQVGYIDETDSTCQTQAVAIEVGDVASALFALAISAHTACILAFRYKPPKWSVWVVIASIWALVITLTVIGPEALERSKDGQFYGNAGAWCWIAPAYQDERLYLHYLFVFISMFGSFTLYTLCGLALKQIWPFNRELAIIQRPPSVSGTQSSGSSGNQRGSRQDTVQMRDLPSFARLEKMARTMIFYPIVFSSLVLPLSVYRLAVMNGHKWSLKALCAAGFLYTTCGVADVIIFSLTSQTAPEVRLVRQWQ
ncbi:hypothetical protein BT69DRAFT_1342378 [Atractiella rhizophila]|nr:hypothetical protein BT69DRAFT_1342378 [Atractiella rhizophila]